MSELRKSKSRSYPPELLNAILDFVAPLSAHAIAVDLGCGPGQLTALLAEADAFERVIGVDPSEIMIERARSMDAHAKLEYTVGTAENMQGLEDGSVSLVTAAVAAHWFDHKATYPELARVLRPGGTIAYIGYGLSYFSAHPQATAIVEDYFRVKMGPYWQQPGNSITMQEYDTLPFPSDFSLYDPSSFRRIKYNLEASTAYRPLPSRPGLIVHDRRPPILERSWTRLEFRQYLDTLSAIHKHQEQHSSTNLADDFLAALIEAGVWNGNEREVVRWPLTLMLMRKKS